jgi:hypothetical protein
MHKPLAPLPLFDGDAFAAKLAQWKPIIGRAVPGMARLVVEWNIIKGPTVFVYPASQRSAGEEIITDSEKRGSDERWADYLEEKYVPQVVSAIKSAGLTPQVICTDLRPVQTQRARLRAIAAAAREKSGVAPHH